MGNYDDNKKITELDALTTLAEDDVFVIGDTSDSGKAKKITKANTASALGGTKVKVDIDDTTSGFLDEKIELTSDDGSVIITKTIQNPGGVEKIVYDLSAQGGSGGGSTRTISATATTLELGTNAGDTVTVWVKGNCRVTGTPAVLELKYNGVTKDTVTIADATNGNNTVGFAMEYTEVPGEATEDITVSVASGSATLGNVVIIAQIVSSNSSIRGGLSKLTQTFTFTDFADVGGVGVATFTDSLPEDAVPIGVIYEITEAFDFASNDFQVKSGSTSGNIIGAPVNADNVGTVVGMTDGSSTDFDFAADPNPVIYGNTVPTQGAATVTILYGTKNSGGSSITTIFPLPAYASVATSAAGLGDNTVASVGLFRLENDITVDQLSFYIQSATTPGTLKIGIYSEDGQTLVANVTTATISSDEVVTTAFGAPVSLSPGNYYIVILPVGASTEMDMRTWAAYQSATDTLLTISGKNVPAGTLTCSADTLPASFDPTTDITETQPGEGEGVPVMRFDA